MKKPDAPGGNRAGGSYEGLHGLLGAYLLGGLEPAEAEAFAGHLAGCALCRGALAELEGLPGLLDAVPVPDAVALTALRPAVAGPVGPSDGQHVLEQLARQRRRARRRVVGLLAAVAAASLAAGALAVGLLAGPLLGARQPDESYSVSLVAGPQVQVGLVEKAWGTELSIDGRSLPQEGTLSLWVVDYAGAEERAASWSAIPAGRARVTGATPMLMDRIATVQIRDAAQQTVAVIPCGPGPGTDAAAAGWAPAG